LLIEDGKALTTILLPARAEPDENKAAQILQKVFHQMTGVNVPIEKDPAQITGHIISVGRTRLVPEPLSGRLLLGKELIIADPRRDAFVVTSGEQRESGGTVLFLLGHRPRGTVFAVYDFLESLGCRWFFAYEAGHCIPRRNRIAVANCDSFKQPHFAFRFVYTWGGPRTKATQEKELAWFEANKMSGELPKEGSSAHNFSAIWPPELYEEHPEYFPLNEVEEEAPIPVTEVREDLLGTAHGTGEKPDVQIEEPVEKPDKPVRIWKRVPYGQRCLSNPDVVRLGIDWACKTMAEHPEYDMVPFIQNDGIQGFCQCANCTKLGHYGDQNIYLANQVGKVFFKRHPNKMIHILSYFESARIPRRKIDGYDTNSDKVWVTIFSNFAKVAFDDLVKGWAEASHHLEIGDAWQYFSGDPLGGPSWPRSYSGRLRRYRFYRDNHVVALKTIVKSEWARHGLARYLSARLMWNVDADINALTDEFCQKMFPNAATEFREFIALYEAVERRQINGRGFLGQGFSRLEQIRKKLKTEAERTRWEFYALYLHELVLEEKLHGIMYWNSSKGTSYDRLMFNRQIVSFLRAIEDRGILESSQRIGMTYLRRLVRLKWAKFSGPNAPAPPRANVANDLTAEEDAVDLGLDEPEPSTKDDEQFKDGLTWHAERMAVLDSVPVLELDADVIDQLFREDKDAYTMPTGGGPIDMKAQ